MKTAIAKIQKESAFALVIVMVFAAISLTALTGALTWTSTSAQQTSRAIQYYNTAAAAEAASEKVLATLREDYQNGSSARVSDRMNTYLAMTPTSYENPLWNDYVFSDGAGKVGTSVKRIKEQEYVELDSLYRGLKGWATTYRINSTAQQKDAKNAIAAGVLQEVQTASIPIFQFAIFYGLDLELHSMTEMHIRGRVHCNGNIYTYPSENTTYWEDVTTAGNIIERRKSGDPDYSSSPPKGKSIYKKKKDQKVATLTLPIGTNSSPEAVREVLFPAPAGESVNSAMSRERYINKAEMVILVTNNAVNAYVKTPYSLTPISIAQSQWSQFLTTNITFTDKREEKIAVVTQVDVGAMKTWAEGNSSVAQVVGGANRGVNLIYVYDQRKVNTSTHLPVVRLKNGWKLPTRGLTVATPNPLYVLGHYNQEQTSYNGTTNVTKTKPASLIADAITVLSPNWSDSSSKSGSNDYEDRPASSMTLNAALLAGIVETRKNPDTYSGGAHNLLRFLEDWDGDTLTYNGSMVVLFNSVRALKPFQQPGDYYYPPERNFTFDPNFLNPDKLPPGTPELRGIIRGTWAQTQPVKVNL